MGLRLRLLVDEDIQAKPLVHVLVDAGHDVLTAQSAGLNSHPDGEVLNRATGENRVVLTRNGRDFRRLHEEGIEHAGILAIFEDSDRSKSMSNADIVRSIGNVESVGVPIAGEFIVLNAWRW